MNTFVFQPGMTWRKLGFAMYSDSLAYREVLDNNPAWDVTQVPSPGTVLYGSTSQSSAGGASQQPSVFSQPEGQASIDYYPYSSQNAYYTALCRYTPPVLKKVERLNGWTSDSYLAITGA